MVGVMPWVLNEHVPEETTIYPHDVVCPEPHFPTQLYHATCPPVSSPWAPYQKEVSNMSSNPTSVSAAAISSYLLSPYGWSSFLLRSPNTRISEPRGHYLSTATTLSIVKVLLGAR